MCLLSSSPSVFRLASSSGPLPLQFTPVFSTSDELPFQIHFRPSDRLGTFQANGGGDAMLASARMQVVPSSERFLLR